MASIKPESFAAFDAGRLLKFHGALLFGPDWNLVQRLRSHVLTMVFEAKPDSEIVRLSSGDLDSQPGRLLEELQGVSLFGSFKLVLVEANSAAAQKACISAVSVGWSEAFLAVLATDLKKSIPLRKEFEAAPDLAAVICFEQTSQQLVKAVRERLASAGLDSTEEVASALVETVSGNTALIDSEVDKVITYVMDKAQVELADIEAACALNRSSSVDRILDMAFAGRAGSALAALRDARTDGALATSIQIALSNRFLMLAEMYAASSDGRRVDAVVKEWRPPVFWKRQSAVLNQVRNLGNSDISMLLDAMYTANATGRISRVIEWPILERLVMALAARLKSRA